MFVDYRNFEQVLNAASLGNLNRQFVSLLRSEQDAERPIVGNPETFETLLGENATLFRMKDALNERDDEGNRVRIERRSFPVAGAARWVWHNKGVVIPGVNLALETVGTYLFGKRVGSDENWRWIRGGAMTSLLTTVSVASMHAGAEFSKWWEKWGGGFVGS